MSQLPRALLIVLLCTAPARAWIYPEHRQIGVAAWHELNRAERGYFAALWRRAGFGYSAGLCQEPIADAQVSSPPRAVERSPCIDFAAWPALAGDHACSPADLLESVLPSFWVHRVARVSAGVASDLAAADTLEARENVWIASNLRLQSVDKEYVTRAGANNAHFLLARTGATPEGSPRIAPPEIGRMCLKS